MAANEPQNVSYKIATCTDAPLHNDTKTQSECINRIKYYYLLLFCYSVCVFSYAKDAAQRIKITFQLYTTDLESESRASRVLYRFAYFWCNQFNGTLNIIIWITKWTLLTTTTTTAAAAAAKKNTQSKRNNKADRARMAHTLVNEPHEMCKESYIFVYFKYKFHSLININLLLWRKILVCITIIPCNCLKLVIVSEK